MAYSATDLSDVTTNCHAARVDLIGKGLFYPFQVMWPTHGRLQHYTAFCGHDTILNGTKYVREIKDVSLRD